MIFFFHIIDHFEFKDFVVGIKSLDLKQTMSTKEYRIGRCLYFIYFFVTKFYPRKSIAKRNETKQDEEKRSSQKFTGCAWLNATMNWWRQPVTWKAEWMSECEFFRIASGWLSPFGVHMLSKCAIATCYHTETDRREKKAYTFILEFNVIVQI